MANVTPTDYAFVFIVLILAWPFSLLNNLWIFGACLIVNAIIFGITVYFTSSRRLSFWRGLKLLCDPYLSGCANITFIYIFFILIFYYVCAVFATGLGVYKGKTYTEDWWIDTIIHRQPQELSSNLLGQVIVACISTFFALTGLVLVAEITVDFFSRIFNSPLNLFGNIEFSTLILLMILGLVFLLVGSAMLRNAIIKINKLRSR